MEEVTLKFELVTKALCKLKCSLDKLDQDDFAIDYEELRDSIIQRFEFSIDTLAKFLLAYLTINKGILITDPSPRKIFRLALDTALINQQEFKICIKMVEDRNRTSHTYNEEIAQEIAEKIPQYHNLMIKILKKAI